MVAGFLLAWPRVFPILSLSLSGRLPIIALFRLGMIFFPSNRTVKGSNISQLMAGLTEEIDIFYIFVGNTFSTDTIFTNVRVYAQVLFFGRPLEKGDYQTDFIPILAEGFPTVVQFDFAILYKALSIGRVTFEWIDT